MTFVVSLPIGDPASKVLYDSRYVSLASSWRPSFGICLYRRWWQFEFLFFGLLITP